MKRLAALATLFISITPLILNAASGEHRGYLIKLKNSRATGGMPSGMSGGIQLLSNLGIHASNSIPKLQIIQTDKNPFEMTLTSGEKEALNEMVEYVEPNYLRRVVVGPPVQASEIQDSFNMKLINAPDAWKVSTGTKNTIVAVSDTGVWHHSELEPNYWYNQGEMGLDAKGKDKKKNKIDDDGNGFVDDYAGWDWTGGGTNTSTDSMYHGTHVSGILGAKGGNNQGITGVSWDVSIMSVKFIDRDGSGSDINAIKSLIYAADNGARAVNCSWGGSDPTKALQDAIAYLQTKGVLVVAASGNDAENTDKHPHYPSALPNENIISVASVDNLKGDLSFFSNWGFETVDIGAPGYNIYSTWNPTYSSAHQVWFYTISGTSMAAPHVTGAIALMYSVNPDLNWRQVKDILMSTVTKAPKLKGKIASEGMMNVGAAVRAAAALK
jgi:subtilisin family serine protease